MDSNQPFHDHLLDYITQLKKYVVRQVLEYEVINLLNFNVTGYGNLDDLSLKQAAAWQVLPVYEFQDDAVRIISIHAGRATLSDSIDKCLELMMVTVYDMDEEVTYEERSLLSALGEYTDGCKFGLLLEVLVPLCDCLQGIKRS